MSRISNLISSFVSAVTAPQTSPTRETARSVPIPASALEILNRGSNRVATGQTGFDAPVGAQRAQLGMQQDFETPAPRPRNATQAPGQPAQPLPQSEVTRAAREAGQMFQTLPPGDWAARAQELAAQHKGDFNGLKFALHKEMTAAKEGRAATTPGQSLPQSEVTRAAREAGQMFQTLPPGDWAARAQELAAQYKGNFDGLKFALHKEMTAAKEGRATTTPGQALPQSEVTRAAREAGQMFQTLPPGDWAARAQELAAQYKDNFDGLKFALHKEMIAAKEGRAATTPGQALPQSEVDRAVREAGQMFQTVPPGDWAARARELAALNKGNFDAVKFGLHKEMIAAKEGRTLTTPGTPLPASELQRALNESHRMVFGGNVTGKNVGAWMARAQELATEHKNDFEALKFALQKEMNDLR